MYESDNISIYYWFYLKWKQVYNNYVTSDIKPPQSFFEKKKLGLDITLTSL
jgi:hypothetical protein